MFKRLLSVGGFTLLSRIAGFAQNIVMAAILGDGLLSDAYFVALRLPNSFRGIFAEGAFNVAFIPRYAALRTREGDSAAALFADRVFSWQMAAQIALLVAALLFMPQIVSALAPGFAHHPGQIALAIDFSRITFPYLILTVVAVQLSAMLNAHEKFAAAAAWSIFLNLAIIGTLLCSRWFSNAGYAASWGVMLAGILQLVFIVWAAARSGILLRLAWPRWTAQMREFLWALGAATLGSASVQIGLFIDTIIASFLPSGVLTAINYADRINQLPLGTIAIALATVLLPEMSRRVAMNDRAGADAAQNNAAALGLYLTLPFAAAFLLVPQTIMRALFAHGAFSVGAADISASALAAYGVGLPAFVLVRVVAATFYARGDTATPVRATILAVAVNVGLKFLLVWGFHLGAVGVALGTSFGSWANVSLLLWLATRRDLLTVESHFTRALPAIVLAAAATGAAAWSGVWLGETYMHLHRFHYEALFGLALLFGGLAYGLVTLLFRRTLPLGRVMRGSLTMDRLFVALAIPDPVARHLALLQSGMPNARWQSREQLHLTLRFIGEVDGRDTATIDDALAMIDAPAFELAPHGVGEFGGKHPDALWAGVRPSEALNHLQRKVETAVQRAGQKLDHQKYVPHITLARLNRGTSPGRVIDWLTDHALFSALPFAVTEFALYSSVLTDDGSLYRVERTYPLR